MITGLLLMVSLGVEKAVAASVERRLVTAAQASVHSGKR